MWSQEITKLVFFCENTLKSNEKSRIQNEIKNLIFDSMSHLHAIFSHTGPQTFQDYAKTKPKATGPQVCIQVRNSLVCVILA